MTELSRAAWIALGLVGAASCGGPGQAGQAPANAATESTATRDPEAVRLVDAAFAELRLGVDQGVMRPASSDSSAPDLPQDHLAPAAAMFVEACRLGDQASCWHSMYVDDNEEATIACGKNCLAGHTMSCRALEESAGRPTVGDYSAEEAISLCRAGLADACIAAAGHDEANALSWYRRGCELESNAACIAGWVELGDSSPDDGWDRATWDQRGEAAAARECSRGFSSACQTVEAPSERVLELARAGCWAGLLLDCQILYEETVDDAERILAADHLCLFSVELCQELGNLRLTAKDPTLRSAQGARDAYERGCAWDLKTCFALGVLYARGQLPEPVKGRGLALVEDSCPIAEQGCDVLVELRASVPAAP